MHDSLVAAIYGGVLGAVVSGWIAWRMATKARSHNYYSTLLKLMTDHNWNCLKAGLRSGLAVTFADEKINTLCYQHMNLMLFAWLHREIIASDGTLEGWKCWARAIVEDANREKNLMYGYAYRDILVHGDIYPPTFIAWLKTVLGLSADRFPVPEVQGAKPIGGAAPVAS